jgi:hypothetical protein
VFDDPLLFFGYRSSDLTHLTMAPAMPGTCFGTLAPKNEEGYVVVAVFLTDDIGYLKKHNLDTQLMTNDMDGRTARPNHSLYYTGCYDWEYDCCLKCLKTGIASNF